MSKEHNAVKILHNRYIKNDPERLASLEEERKRCPDFDLVVGNRCTSERICNGCDENGFPIKKEKNADTKS